MATLNESIQALANYDFEVPQGFSTDLYLNGEDGVIETFQSSANSYPEAAHNKQWVLIFSIKTHAIASSVVEYLESIEDLLEEMIDCYKGIHYDGRNHVGVWSDNLSDLFQQLGQRPSEIASYWEPSDWFQDSLSELKAQWQQGKKAAEIIALQHLGNDTDGMCDEDAAIGWLEIQIEEWELE